MVSKKVTLLFLINISVFITYLTLLVFNYSNISETVVSHINIYGKIDGYSNKISLFISAGINLAIVILIWFLIKRPQYANFPLEINNRNRESVYKKMQLFLSIIAILTSTSFSYMIFKAIHIEKEFIYLTLYIILTPIFALVFFKDKNN